MGDDRLTRHMTVLHRMTSVSEVGLGGESDVTFRSPDDSGADHVLYLDTNIWVDMGEPDEVTITVQPDDQLNAGQRLAGPNPLETQHPGGEDMEP